jgi:hypothetical protein
MILRASPEAVKRRRGEKASLPNKTPFA